MQNFIKTQETINGTHNSEPIIPVINHTHPHRTASHSLTNSPDLLVRFSVRCRSKSIFFTLSTLSEQTNSRKYESCGKLYSLTKRASNWNKQHTYG